jgi:hypothetical protein
VLDLGLKEPMDAKISRILSFGVVPSYKYLRALGL